MKNKLIFIACAIVWAVGIAVLLFSCSASRSTGITIVPAVAAVHDTIYIEKSQDNVFYPVWRNIDTAFILHQPPSESDKSLKEFFKNEWSQYNPRKVHDNMPIPVLDSMRAVIEFITNDRLIP